jgi:3-hydroxybutyryl-CoA dehydrogenase
VAQTVGIIGAGTMGSGIAQVCVAAGKHVRLYDPDEAALAAAGERVADGLDRMVAKQRLDEPQRNAAMSALELVADIEAAASDADVVIEAAAERLEVKQAIFEELDGICSAETVLATNTSSLSVEACAAATRRPERVIGLHFFNPAPLMALVEVAATHRTNQPTTEAAIELVSSLGKTAVHCADSPGFIVNRVGRPYLLEAARILEAGMGSVAGIDAALEGAGYPMGPFRLIDLIGLDVDVAIDDALFEAFDDAPRFEAPKLQRALVEEGRLGRKNGHGYYRYGADRSAVPDVEVSAAAAMLSNEEIVERFQLATINEAYRAVEEGVASPPDVDTAMRLGAGYPRGPFEMVDDLGLRHIVTRLHDLNDDLGDSSNDQYEVTASLWQMATV